MDYGAIGGNLLRARFTCLANLLRKPARSFVQSPGLIAVTINWRIRINVIDKLGCVLIKPPTQIGHGADFAE